MGPINNLSCFLLGKKAACFALGGYFKGKNDNDDLPNLLQCEVECCTGNKCNTQVPTLSPNAIAVFTPSGNMNIIPCGQSETVWLNYCGIKGEKIIMK